MSKSFVQQQEVAPSSPPHRPAAPIRWLQQEIFSSPFQAIGTLAGLYIAFYLVWSFVDFAILKAVWTGADRLACFGENIGATGACWPFIWDKLGQLLYGFYPADERWRVNLVYAVAVALLVPLLMPDVRWKAANAVAFFVLFPILAYVLLHGGPVFSPWFAVASVFATTGALVALALHLKMLNEEGGRGQVIVFGAFLLTLIGAVWFRPSILPAGAFATLAFVVVVTSVPALLEARSSARGDGGRWAGRALGFAAVGIVLAIAAQSQLLAGPSLRVVPTNQWGGLFLTLVVATTAIVASLPIGIVLALARRSSVPLVRMTAICLIEVVRGAPLITVLFFATYMLPFFMERSPDALVRVLIGASLFGGAYMAETIRGGLQAIPKGQFEAAEALGLDYPKSMGLIVLPQALRIVIPGIVNNFIALFKDTTLVSIVALYDLLGMMRAALTDPAWAGPSTLYTGFAFAGIFYFLFCYPMSSYSQWVERRLQRDHRS